MFAHIDSGIISVLFIFLLWDSKPPVYWFSGFSVSYNSYDYAFFTFMVNNVFKRIKYKSSKCSLLLYCINILTSLQRLRVLFFYIYAGLCRREYCFIYHLP